MQKSVFQLVLLCLFSLGVFGQTKLNLTVSVSGFSKHSHTLYYAVFNKEEGFLNNEAAIMHGGVPVRSDRATFSLALPKGKYAITCFQDLNDNKKLDKRTFPPIPKEPYGFSNDPRIMGKPKFEKCSFDLVNDKTISITIKD